MRVVLEQSALAHVGTEYLAPLADDLIVSLLLFGRELKLLEEYLLRGLLLARRAHK